MSHLAEAIPTEGSKILYISSTIISELEIYSEPQ